MTYSTSSSKKEGGGLVYNIQWKGRFDPIATCDDYRDARRICDALNKLENQPEEKHAD